MPSGGERCIYQIDIALHTGMRLTEQFTTTWDRVDLSRGFIYLSITKNGSDRFVHLNSNAIKTLKALRALHDKAGLPRDSLLFLGKLGEPISNPKKWFGTALKLAGINGVTWHTLHHTFASRLVMAGVNLKTVQDLIGHKTIAITARYAHLAPDDKLRALETLVRAGTNAVQSGPVLVPSTKREKSVKMDEGSKSFIPTDLLAK
jgi:integrase